MDRILIKIFLIHLKIYEGAGRLRGSGDDGREGEVRGGRREKRRREEGEGRKMGGRDKEKNFAREARAAPRREEGDKGAGGEVRGWEEERPIPLSAPSYIDLPISHTSATTFNSAK